MGPSGEGQPTGFPQEAAAEVLRRCSELGFALSGIAPVRPSEWQEHLRRWLAAGRHGEMAYLAEELAIRAEPARVFDGARSFIVVADQYARRGDDESVPPMSSGRIARYARGKNYHDVVKRRLHALADGLREVFPGSDFRSCVDTVPILERELAVLAGLGWVGKNTMVIHPRLGSYFVLGVVATNLELQPASTTMPDHCGTCTRCIDACPTDAITPYSVDGSKCVSYLTIERRGQIPRELHKGIGSWLFGCDVCQEVCPHNSARGDDTEVGRVFDAYRPVRSTFDLLSVLNWQEDDRRSAFAGSAMKRVTLAMIRRNALIAAGNAVRGMSGEDTARSALIARLRDIASDDGESELVRLTALEVTRGLAAG